MPILKRGKPTFVRFSKIDKKAKKVWGVVYAPMMIDAHNDVMTAEEIEKAAHGFLPKADLATAVDENHGHIPTWSQIIESYIVREPTKDFPEIGAWVMGMKITRDGIWNKILRGELTGYSFEGTGYKREAKVTVSYQRYRLIFTTPAEDGHVHLAHVEVDENGRVIKGWTNAVNGHKHDIIYNTITEFESGHRHRLRIDS